MYRSMKAAAVAAVLSVAASGASAASLGLAVTGPIENGTSTGLYIPADTTGVMPETITFDFVAAALTGPTLVGSWSGDPSVDLASDLFSIEEASIEAIGSTTDTLEFQLGAGFGYANGSLLTIFVGPLGTGDFLDELPIAAAAAGLVDFDGVATLQGLDTGTAVIPVPATAILLGSALLGVGMFRRKAA